ncbi:unnamed protein product [Prorocentrum cordatum]|uniref:Uncharacterized protein n=1 Tax=Prorocentrum cordatum TaxID=2364126 RepID=A0ABN9SE97_9DINO|nr:unnamed protein product [Polarella glacialis]
MDARGGGVVASVGELLGDGMGPEVVGDDDEAAAALEGLEPSPADPLVIEPNSFFLSTGFNGDGGQQCDFAWLALRVTGAPEQLVRARFFFTDDARWDWWAASPGVAGGISPSALLHICAGEPRGVEAPAGCDELVHVVDARRLEAEDIAEVFSNCLPRNPEAVWPADLLGPRAARLTAPRLSARPTKETERTAVGHSAPLDGPLGDSALSARAAGLPLNLEPARDELRARLAAARGRFASAAPGAAAAGAPLGSAEGGPSEGKPKKRGLAEALAERLANVAKASSAEAARGSSGPVAAAVASEGAAGAGAKELATALMAALKSSATQAAGSSGAGAASDPLRAADGAAATGGLATKRAHCRLSELTLMQMAEFLGAVEADAARLKAAQVAVGDGHWGAAKWLELIHAEDEPTTLRNEEEEMIRSIEPGELKLEELSSRLRRAPKGSARAGDAPPNQRVAQLDNTAETLPAGGLQAPRNFKAARVVCPGKDGETSTESRGQRRLQTLPWLLEQRELASASLPRGTRGLPAAGCAARVAGAWRNEVAVQFGAIITSIDMTVHLVQLGERHPGSPGTFSREFAERVSTLCGSGRRVRDLLPLPLPCLLAVRRWCTSRDAGRRCRARPFARQVADEAWLLLAVAALNCKYFGRCRKGWRHRPILSQVQQQATGFLEPRVVDFVGGPLEQVSAPAADAALGEATVGYSGEAVAKALPCVLADLASSGLPQREHATVLGALDFVEHDVPEWLASPEKALLPEADWPDPRPRARANIVDRAGWHELAVRLAELRIAAVLSEDLFVGVRREPLLNGPIAVAKEGKPGPGGERVTRLILNMVLGNALLEPPVGEASLLVPSASWAPLRVPEGKRLLWTGDDQRGAFFVWRAPEAWHPYMAVGRSLASALFGRPERQECVAPAVIATGWMLAAPIFQRIHRRLRRLPPPRGAGLPPELEWHKDEARPIVEPGSGCEAAWWQVYIDDLGAPEIVDEARARQFGGAEADCQQCVRESYRCAGPKVLSTAALCLAMWSQERVPWRVCMMDLGKLRPPLRARVEGMVTVPGASEFGGGVCASTSPRGEAALALKFVRQVVDHLGVGTRLLNMPVDPRRGELFDGIGGLAVSLSKLPVRIVACVTAETDAKARHVVQLRWPGAIGGGGATRGNEGRVQDLFDTFSETVDAGVAGTGGGLHGRRGSLCYEVPWIFWLLRQTFGRRFYALLENVARMAPPLRLVDKGRYLEVMADNGPLLVIERTLQHVLLAESALARPPLSVPEITRVGQCRETWGQRGGFEDSSGDPNIEEARFSDHRAQGSQQQLLHAASAGGWIVMAIAADMYPPIGRHRADERHRRGRVLPVAQAWRRLDLSWALRKAWRRVEPAERTLPFTPDIAAGMASLAVEAGAFDLSCLLLVSFEGLLRGGEAFALTVGDVFGRGTQSCSISRRPRPQLARSALRALAHGQGLPGRYSRQLAWRRGASDFFLRSSSMEAAIGRRSWASSMTARICVEGAEADLARAWPADQAPATPQRFQPHPRSVAFRGGGPGSPSLWGGASSEEDAREPARAEPPPPGRRRSAGRRVVLGRPAAAPAAAAPRGAGRGSPQLPRRCAAEEDAEVEAKYGVPPGDLAAGARPRAEEGAGGALKRGASRTVTLLPPKRRRLLGGA